MQVADVGEDVLLPYVPRLLRSWPADTRHRAVDGTLVSADLSGFTALSEKLAALGREGGEELTGLLNNRFSGMIEIVEQHGGDVLKFGGDALLILFEGDGHATRACDSTLAMRSLVAQPLFTSTGRRVRLKISQGMHSGTFHLFVLEGNHRELMVTGPGTTETVECEGEAVAGQVLCSAGTAALVEPRRLGTAIGERRILRKVTTSEAPAPAIDLREAADDDVAEFVPTSQREQIFVGAPSEHRRVTTAFVKFSHTDALIEREGPGALHERLQALAGRVAGAELEFGVHWLASDVYPDGGKFILTAGAPVSFGDDEERMLRAVRSIVSGTDDVDVRAGINVGPVFVGNLGSSTRRTFTVMGDAVNLAARLMQKAESGQVVASNAVLDRSSTTFRVEELEPFLVKGKTAPIRAAVVHEPLARREQERTLQLIGRDAELKTLLDAAASARAGAGRIAELVGEPGAGKTRLLEELRAREPELPLVTVQCGQYARTSPYFAIRPALRTAAGIPPDAGAEAEAARLTAWVNEVAPELAPLLPLIAIAFDIDVPMTPEVSNIAPQFRRPRAHEAVADLLEALARTPTIVLIEDLHWVDDASADLINVIVARAASLPWLIVLTRRPGPPPIELDPSIAASIELEPLDEHAALDLLRAAAGDDAALLPDDWTKLAERASGNPLFAIELAQAAATNSSADVLADSVESLVTTKIDTLPARERLLLREASVLGAVVDLDILGDALDNDDVRAAGYWRALEDFLVPEDGAQLRFRHAIHRQVAYEGLPYRRRREMHRMVAEAIRRRVARPEAVSGLLSTHYFRAGAHADGWKFSRLAGDEARGKYANVEAAEFYGRALDCARSLGSVSGDELATVATARGEALDLTGEYQAARRAFAFARKQVSNDSVRCAELLRKEGRILEYEARYTNALRTYARALKLLEESGEAPPIRASLLAAYGMARYRQGRLTDAVRWAERAIAESEQTENIRALAHACLLIELCLEDLGDPRRLEFRGRALPLYEQLDDPSGLADELNNLGSFVFWESLPEALGYFERARLEYERAGDVVGEASAANNAGEMLLLQGRPADALEPLTKAHRVLRAAGYLMGAGIARANLGRADAQLGNTDAGLALLDESIRELEEIQAAPVAQEIRVREVEALVFGGSDAGALVMVEELERLGADGREERFVATLDRMHGWARLRLGDIDGAAVVIDRALQRAEPLEMWQEIALALRARAEITRRQGRPGDAADDERATRLLAQCGVEVAPSLL
jgi:class 3 adenylate cyclase/tetratricopeptide (TPR) repeat protein